MPGRMPTDQHEAKAVVFDHTCIDLAEGIVQDESVAAKLTQALTNSGAPDYRNIYLHRRKNYNRQVNSGE